MPSIQPFCLLSGDEELRSVGVLASIGHGQPPTAIVLQLEVLIIKLVAVDGFAASAVSASEVSSLDHKVLDHAVKFAAFVCQLGA